MRDIKPESAVDTTPISGSVGDFRIDIKMAGGSSIESVWDRLVSTYHYLGYKKLLGHRLKYLAFINDRPVAAISFSAPALKLKSRDIHIGWSDDQRREYLHFLACNSRFVILPWVTIKNLASHVLSRTINYVKKDWEKKFGRPLLLLETFVDPERFKGTTYKAANWTYVGRTYGSAKKGPGYVYHGKPKEIYLYALDPAYRNIIGCRGEPRIFHHPVPPAKNKLEVFKKKVLPRIPYHPILISGLHPHRFNTTVLSDELIKFHDHFSDCFGRIEHKRLSMMYLSGLISNAAGKSVESMARAFLGPESVRSLQRFLRNYGWDHEAMLLIHQRLLSGRINDPWGMICIDSSEFIKKGKESVGVARQPCGEKGEFMNCQSGIFAGYAGHRGYGLIESRLFMPETWFTDENKNRREKSRVPKDLNFQTKSKIALELIERVKRSGFFNGRWIGCDVTFGSDPDFLNALPKDWYYLAAIPPDYRVFTSRHQTGAKDRSGAMEVSRISASSRLKWVPITATTRTCEGTEMAIAARKRVYLCRNGMPAGKGKWLFIRKNRGGQTRYAISNAPARIHFSRLLNASLMHRSVEQYFKKGESCLGMGGYEHRSWPAWHRHMIFVFLGLHFLLRMQLHPGKKPFPGTTGDAGDATETMAIQPRVYEDKPGTIPSNFERKYFNEKNSRYTCHPCVTPVKQYRGIGLPSHCPAPGLPS